MARTCNIVSPKGFRERIKYELRGANPTVFIKLMEGRGGPGAAFVNWHG